MIFTLKLFHCLKIDNTKLLKGLIKVKTKENFCKYVNNWFNINGQPKKTIDTEEKVVFEINTSLAGVTLADTMEWTKERFLFLEKLEDKNTKLELFYRRVNERINFQEDYVFFTCYGYPIQYALYEDNKVKEYSDFMAGELAESKSDLKQLYHLQIMEKQLQILEVLGQI